MKELKTGDGVTFIPMSDVLEITEAYIAFRTPAPEACSVVTKVDRENGVVTFDAGLPSSTGKRRRKKRRVRKVIE